MTTPFFSIIIPTYNSSKTIARCLDSIIGQVFTNFELIISDGSSSDNTLEIVNQYKWLHPDIIILSERDNGIYDAMNKAIARASGEWVYFLGSDDYLLGRNVLNELTQKIKLDDFDYVYGNVFSPEYGDNYDGEFDSKKILEKNICHQALFVRKKLLQKMGGFNTRYKLLADYDFNLRCMFDKRVRKRHVDLLVAFYAPAGSSSTITDETFAKDKSWLILKYGFSAYNWRQRFQMCDRIVREFITRIKK